MLPIQQHVVNSNRPKWSPAGAAFTDFLMRVFPLNHELTAAGEAIANVGNQTLARWLVLEQIQDQPATVADIARSIGHARQGIQRLADLLVDSGAAKYDTNPRHQRASLLRLTSEGLASLRTIQQAQRVWADRLGDELGKAQLVQASQTLEQALAAVTRELPALTQSRTAPSSVKRRRRPDPE
jgi:DNA-binding MarR family transcriptional regulator